MTVATGGRQGKERWTTGISTSSIDSLPSAGRELRGGWREKGGGININIIALIAPALGGWSMAEGGEGEGAQLVANSAWSRGTKGGEAKEN